MTYEFIVLYEIIEEEDAAKLLKEVVITPTRESKLRKCWKNNNKKMNVTCMNEDKALSLLVNAKLTKHQYQLIK